MQPDLAAFLARHTRLVEERAVWDNGRLHLRVTAYLGNTTPPSKYITSVRALVFRDDSILVLCNSDGVHIVPGGRREGQEALEETLRREVLEEAGWTLTELSMLGFVHFHHLSPKPPGYPYSYPDFVQVVYCATAESYIPGARVADDYEFEAVFRPVAEVQALELTPGQHLYLQAALAVRTTRL